ncbi:LexA family protein [Marinobacterium sp. BA1]|uniref:LexA family protein n=1 Tax=Marinobacterium sp. BA1 TaxID=3138931 RepID=UPI0032E5B69F
MSGDEMHGIGIHDGDVLVIDSSITPSPGDIIMVDVQGDFYCREFGGVNNTGVKLIAHGSGKTDVKMVDPNHLEVFGVIAGVVRQMRSSAGGVPYMKNTE